MDNWYKKALERARKAYDSEATSSLQKQILADIFPELVESNDEKNWKAVLGYVKDDALRVWLEKQKECSFSNFPKSCDDCPKEIQAAIDKEFGINGRDDNDNPLNGYGDWKKGMVLNGPAIWGLVKLGIELQKEQKPKMTPKWLYRLEFKDSSCGLWYDGSGKWCFESGIGSIGGCKTKTLPMDYDARYKQDGRDWFSSCSRKEDLMHWYSLEDAKELISKGFVFTRYLATEYHEYDQQTVFIKETALCREQIDIFELFGQKSAEWSEEDDAAHTRIIGALAKAFRSILPTKPAEEDIEWFKSLPERFNLQSKQEWGEEDEVYLRDALWCVEEAEKHCKDKSDRGACWSAERWLKSLRPQPQWKPTEEQMLALKRAIEEMEKIDSNTASTLALLKFDLQNS